MDTGGSLVIALDAMGGDKAPHIVAQGAKLARQAHPDLRFIFYGDEKTVLPQIRSSKTLKDAWEFEHTDEVVGAHDKPSAAVRQNKRTSMRRAIEAVKDGKADAVVSAGNTGAFMAMSKLVLRTLPGVSRPAIAGNLPTNGADVIMLDLGANVQSDARDLYHFAIMGDAYARAALGAPSPRIALLNIGSEDIKGHDELHLAAQLLKEETHLNFKGFCEGDDILSGDFDVVVADGFTGNVALKTVEGTAAFFSYQLKKALRESFWGKMGYLLARPAFYALRKRVDPRCYNGAVFVGLSGVAVKSHGGADGYAFSHAIEEAYRFARGRVNERIIEEMAALARRKNGDAPPPPLNFTEAAL